MSLFASTGRLNALNLEKDGIYPVVLSVVQKNVVVARLNTFVNYVDPRSKIDQLPISLMADINTPLALQPDGSIQIGDGIRTQLTNLISVLSVGAAPMSLHIAPELLDGLGRSSNPADIALLAQLEPLLAVHELLTNTFVSFDPSSASRSLMKSEFAEQLESGRAVLDVHNREGVISENVWFSRSLVDDDGMKLLGESGIQSVVFTPQAAASIGTLDSYLKPYKSVVGNSLAIRVSDPGFAKTLSGLYRNPVQQSFALAAEIVAQQQEIILAGGKPNERQLLLSSTSGALPDRTIMVPLLLALARAPQLNMVGLSAASLAEESTTAVVLPRTTRVDLAATKDVIAKLRSEVQSTSTMLPPDATQHALWKSSLLATSADTLDADEFARYVKGLRGQLRTLRLMVSVPDSLTFTLGSKLSDLRLQVRNESTVALSVKVELASAKLQFPQGPQIVTIAPNSAVDVVVPVQARANGSFPLNVILTTPDGLTQVGQPTRLTARVSALAGLGQVATGAAILILMSWWIAHWRARKRAQAVRKHPALQ
ncbi:MAG: hypothetical protein F2714_02245 [Actinobacteria bacterium]|uniref:Unannotated protein n=1 Tax=freshwater metagenome TaxID=449393 RepID=A0A6J6UIB6_9ZZZZ|nr:hypothetical protein [Actinomycetota bacterium]